MKCIVFYDSWQMECCGVPFSVGDSVKWLVCKAESTNFSTDLGKIDYYYEAHSSNWKRIFVLEGRVEAVNLIYRTRAEFVGESPRFEFVEAENTADGVKSYDDMELSGYSAKIGECKIRHAKKEEVTYK